MPQQDRERVKYSMDKGVHVGHMLRAFMKEKGLNQAEVARRASLTPQALSGMLNRGSMQVEVLFRISNVLQHDFFADIGRMLTIAAAEPQRSPRDKDHPVELSIKASAEELDRVTRFLERFREVANGD